jgi:hypothetical protein
LPTVGGVFSRLGSKPPVVAQFNADMCHDVRLLEDPSLMSDLNFFQSYVISGSGSHMPVDKDAMNVSTIDCSPTISSSNAGATAAADCGLSTESVCSGSADAGAAAADAD